MCRKEIERSEDEIKKDRKIIEEYKQICTNHQSKFESERERSAIQLEQITEKVKNCPSCAAFVAELAQKDGCASPSGESANSSLDAESDKYKDTLLKRISDLETELIKTKVALAEAEDRNGVRMGFESLLDMPILTIQFATPPPSFSPVSCTPPAPS